jgi:hypothetical protein
MCTYTTIERLPGNWNRWEGQGDVPDWGVRIAAALDAELERMFGGYLFIVGSEIHGPATLKFAPTNYDDEHHCYRYERDTPDRADVPGVEILDNDDCDWFQELWERVSEQVMNEMET